MISLRQRVLWASLMASAAFAASAQQPVPVSAPVPAQVAPAATDVAPQKVTKDGAQSQSQTHKRADRKKLSPAERHAHLQKRMAERQAQLKSKLKLDASQEAAWSNYVAAITPPAPKADQPRPERVDFSKLTTPERLDRMQAIQAERQARFDKHAQAVKQFYAQLSAEQQKTFDAETAKRPGKRPGHGPHHHRGGPGAAPASQR